MLHHLTDSATAGGWPTRRAGLAMLASIWLVACGGSTGSQPGPPAAPGSATVAATAGGAGAALGASAAQGAGPPVSVTTVPVLQRDVPVEVEATGTVSALSSVDVKPQVANLITQVHVREGQFVRRGELLFTLDARADEANLAKARAQLEKDEAALADARRQAERSRDLLARNFISQGAVDTNQTQVEAAAAVVSADKAAIEAARVALSYSRISAPSAGRIGTVNAFAGSYVQPSGGPMLTITQLDPIAVSFGLPQRYLADVLPLLRTGSATVLATLPDKRTAPLKGVLQFVDSAIDANSGTVKVKAVFANKEQALWPGAYANVKLTAQVLKDALVLPQAAVIQNPRGKLVYVVEAGNKVAQRPVELVHAAGLDAVVTGVRAGERVVLDGRQNLRPGSTVVDRGADKPAAGGRNRPGGGGAGFDAAGAASASAAVAGAGPGAGVGAGAGAGARGASPAGSKP